MKEIENTSDIKTKITRKKMDFKNITKTDLRKMKRIMKTKSGLTTVDSEQCEKQLKT